MAQKYKYNFTPKNQGSQGFTTDFDFDLTGIKQLQKRLNEISNRHVRWGWIHRKKHPPTGLLVETLADMHEHGYTFKNDDGEYKTVPPRPYFRQSLEDAKKVSIKNAKEIFKSVLYGEDYTAQLDKAGYDNKQTFHKSVMKQNMPKLSEITINNKGHAFQWDETGWMLQMFDYKVFKSSYDRTEQLYKNK